jgi:tetratricopeptide (TPR) repeat protein
MGVFFDATGRTEESLKYFREANDEDYRLHGSCNPKRAANLVGAYLKLNEFDDARIVLERALKDKIPQGAASAELVLMAGTFYDMNGEFEDAEKYYRKTIAVSPRSVEVYYNLANMLANRMAGQPRGEEAVQIAKECLKIMPKYKHAISLLDSLRQRGFS